MSKDTSDAFFNTFSGSKPTKTADQLNLTSKPPPPAAAAGTSYYSAGAAARPKTTRKPGGAPPPPPPPKQPSSSNGGATAATRPMRQPAAPANTAATTSTQAAAAPTGTSYYGAPASAYSAPSASTPVSTTNAPAYNYQPTTAAAPVAAAVTASSGYPYTSVPLPAYNYGAPAPAAVPAAPQVMNPYMLSTSNTVPAPAADAFSGTMDSGAGLSGSMDTNASLSGPMDTSGGGSYTNQSASTFVPQASTAPIGASPLSGGGYNPADFEDDPPLMEELGIHVEHIVGKMRSVVLPFQRFGGNMDSTVIQDADLAGPIALALLLGGELVLSGKFQFGYIYGFGMFGCVTMTLVLNFMSPNDAISFWTVTSILGYSLLPVNLLAAVKLVVVNLGNLTTMGRLLGILTVIWCTVASTRLMEMGCDMRNQRYLIAYPIGLLYTAFVMITIF